ncbi:hypothetical protein U9M48_016365 [Paspalum notatum var. saurae]|uniref:Uncharacterized protein n=1 Tax=Paspalum notatum var. saurae TaxID=547442 RepID=A0AAQ3T6F0_PASNO
MQRSGVLPECLSNFQRMKKGISFNGIETFTFGSKNNKLRIFPPNSYKFRPKDHIILDEVQECILDNFGTNIIIKEKKKQDATNEKSMNILKEGKMPGLYISFEEVVAQKKDGKLDGGISWKKYGDIDEAMNQARKIL